MNNEVEFKLYFCVYSLLHAPLLAKERKRGLGQEPPLLINEATNGDYALAKVSQQGQSPSAHVALPDSAMCTRAW